jgi:hypothetical protein
MERQLALRYEAEPDGAAPGKRRAAFGDGPRRSKQSKGAAV